VLPGPVRRNEIVPDCTSSLKVAETLVVRPTPVVAFAGVRFVTVGAIESTIELTNPASTQ
jgi:hypothetical protein